MFFALGALRVALEEVLTAYNSGRAQVRGGGAKGPPLLFKDRACKINSLLSILTHMFTCLSSQERFRLDCLVETLSFSHGGVSSTKHGKSDLRSPVRHKTLLSPRWGD